MRFIALMPLLLEAWLAFYLGVNMSTADERDC